MTRDPNRRDCPHCIAMDRSDQHLSADASAAVRASELHARIAEALRQELDGAFADERAAALARVSAFWRRPASWGYDLAAALAARFAYRALGLLLDRLGAVTIDQLLGLLAARRQGALPDVPPPDEETS